MIATIIIAAMIQPSIYRHPAFCRTHDRTSTPFQQASGRRRGCPGRLNGRCQFSVTAATGVTTAVTTTGVPAIPRGGLQVRHPGAAQTHRLPFRPPRQFGWHRNTAVPPAVSPRGTPDQRANHHHDPDPTHGAPLPSDHRIVSNSCGNSAMSESIRNECSGHGRCTADPAASTSTGPDVAPV